MWKLLSLDRKEARPAQIVETSERDKEKGYSSFSKGKDGSLGVLIWVPLEAKPKTRTWLQIFPWGVVRVSRAEGVGTVTDWERRRQHKGMWPRCCCGQRGLLHGTKGSIRNDPSILCLRTGGWAFVHWLPRPTAGPALQADRLDVSPLGWRKLWGRETGCLD